MNLRQRLSDSLRRLAELVEPETDYDFEEDTGPEIDPRFADANLADEAHAIKRPIRNGHTPSIEELKAARNDLYALHRTALATTSQETEVCRAVRIICDEEGQEVWPEKMTKLRTRSLVARLDGLCLVRGEGRRGMAVIAPDGRVLLHKGAVLLSVPDQFHDGDWRRRIQRRAKEIELRQKRNNLCEEIEDLHGKVLRYTPAEQLQGSDFETVDVQIKEPEDDRPW